MLPYFEAISKFILIFSLWKINFVERPFNRPNLDPNIRIFRSSDSIDLRRQAEYARSQGIKTLAVGVAGADRDELRVRMQLNNSVFNFRFFKVQQLRQNSTFLCCSIFSFYIVGKQKNV